MLQLNQDPATVDNIYQQFRGNEEQLRAAESLFSNQNTVELIKYYTKEEIPDDLKKLEPFKTFWAILGKNPVLTFLNSEDEEIFDILFRISKLQHLISKPAYTYTFEKSQAMNQLRIYFKAAIKRSIGFDKNKVNERTMEATSVNQIVRSNTEGFNSPQKQGLFSKFRKMM